MKIEMSAKSLGLTEEQYNEAGIQITAALLSISGESKSKLVPFSHVAMVAAAMLHNMYEDQP